MARYHRQERSTSELQWTDTNEPHLPRQSTLFSFDSCYIEPNLISSPSLSKRISFSPIGPSAQYAYAADRGVVEALAVMETGCPMIELRVDGDECPSPLEWHTVKLQHQQHLIRINAPKPLHISLQDIQSVETLDDDTVSNVRDRLGIARLDTIGLQSLTLRLSIKDDAQSDYILIFEECRSAYIWKKGLDTLLKVMHRGEAVTTTIAFCCSALDRINNEDMFNRMLIGDDLESTMEWIEYIRSALPSALKHIDRIGKFSEKSCILDSSDHLSLLRRTSAVRELYMDAKRLSSLEIYELTKDEKNALREVWLSLLADLNVAMIKEHQLRGDMTASIAIPTAILGRQ